MEPGELKLPPGAPGRWEAAQKAARPLPVARCSFCCYFCSLSPSAGEHLTSDRQVTMCGYISWPFNEYKGIHYVFLPYYSDGSRCESLFAAQPPAEPSCQAGPAMGDLINHPKITLVVSLGRNQCSSQPQTERNGLKTSCICMEKEQQSWGQRGGGCEKVLYLHREGRSLGRSVEKVGGLLALGRQAGIAKD